MQINPEGKTLPEVLMITEERFEELTKLVYTTVLGIINPKDPPPGKTRWSPNEVYKAVLQLPCSQQEAYLVGDINARIMKSVMDSMKIADTLQEFVDVLKSKPAKTNADLRKDN